MAELSVMTFTVLNKADRLDNEGLAEAVEFTRRVLGEAGHGGQAYPMSALAALGGGDAGFAAFQADFTAYLSSRRKDDLRASAAEAAQSEKELSGREAALRHAPGLLDQAATPR